MSIQCTDTSFVVLVLLCFREFSPYPMINHYIHIIIIIIIIIINDVGLIDIRLMRAELRLRLRIKVSQQEDVTHR